MQFGAAGALQAELHGSSGAQNARAIRMTKQQGGSQAALGNSKLRLQHLHAVDVDRISLYRSRHGDVMSFVAFQGIGVFDHQDFLVGVGHYYHLRAALQAFLGAGFSFRVRALRTAL